MKGLVYGGPGKRSWAEVPDPKVQDPRDAIIRIAAVTICGTDLHILGGDVLEVESGRVLGHEAVSTVVETGSGVSGLSIGDRVLASCMVVVGSGPIGLAAILTARLFSPAHIIVIDKAESRLQAAKAFGADTTVLADDDPMAVVRSMTGGLGADVVMEAVGTPGTFELCAALVRPGGRVANIGVHGKPATLHLEDLWIRNITITTGLVDTYSTPKLLDMLIAGQLNTGQMVTHRFALEEIMAAYDVFSRPAETGALKVVLTR